MEVIASSIPRGISGTIAARIRPKNVKVNLPSLGRTWLVNAQSISQWIID